jgi:hypothetical protein
MVDETGSTATLITLSDPAVSDVRTVSRGADRLHGRPPPADTVGELFTDTPLAHPWYNRDVPKPFSTAEVPDHPLTLAEAADSFGLSRETVASIRTFVSAPSPGSSTRRAKSGLRKSPSSRKHSNSKKR